MGWHLSLRTRAATVCRTALMAACLLGALTRAQAQTYVTLSNSFISVSLGASSDVAGTIAVSSAPGSLDDPGPNVTTGQPLLVPASLLTQFYYGSKVYVRVDGGFSNVNANGFDYIFGEQYTTTTGTGTSATGYGAWTTYPQVVGNRLTAVWQTVSFLYGSGTTGGGNGQGGGGGGGTNTGILINSNVQITLTVTLVQSTARFQFDIQNLDRSSAHSVGLAFIQDINGSRINASGLGTGADGPLILPNAPGLHSEAVLSGSQVPQYWESYRTTTPATAGTTAQVHSIRGTIRPIAPTQTEPTPPGRFSFLSTQKAHGLDIDCLVNPATPFQYLFVTDCVWAPKANSSVFLDRVGTANSDAAVGLYWEPETIVPNQGRSIKTYIGQDNADVDLAPPMGLSVSAPAALTLAVDKSGATPVPVVTPNPFTVTAYVSNLTDVLGNPVALDNVRLTLQLPKGLILAGSDTATKTIDTVASGQEKNVSWQVQPDPANPATGVLRYAVTAASIGGKTVQRSISVPGAPTFTLAGSDSTGGSIQFKMVSFPLNFGTALPSTVLGFSPTQQPIPFDLYKYNPTLENTATNPNQPVNSLVQGQAYWLRSRFTSDKVITLNSATFQALDPNATYKINYARGWNQIGNPYAYGTRFSEIQVFDAETLTTLSMDQATDASHQWVLPAVYHYNTTDPDPKNWTYELLDNIGFTMQPFEGYWVLVKKANLQFIYNGADAPGAAVTRSILAGGGQATNLGRAATNNWRLRLSAKGASGSDRLNYIGVAPKAIDGPDVYKYDKPPSIGDQMSLDIVHSDWKTGNGRYAQDLRSPALTRKTWDLVVRSVKPNEAVTISWPDIAASVPRNYTLTLINPDSNARVNLRSVSSTTINTGADAQHKFQIVAEPAGGKSRIQITNFDMVSSGGRAAGTPTSVAIHYGLSQNADTRIYIRDGGGRTIRTITTTTRAAENGDTSGSAVWDLRDERGTALSPGVYNVELVALGADGQRSRQIHPYLLTR